MSKTIKIIDLLNKIANGEEVPIKINYHGDLYVWSKERQFYELENKNFIYLSFETKELNDEVEIIEEQEEIDIQSIKEMEKMITHGYGSNETEIAYKVNELVQAVKQLDKNIKEKQ